MTLAQQTTDPIADQFGQLVLGFRRSNGGFAVTSGSYVGTSHADAGTVDYRGRRGFEAAGYPAPDTPALRVDVSGSLAAFTPLAIRLTSIARPDYEMARLEAAAGAGDNLAFGNTLQTIDWSLRPAGDCARAVRLALAAGLHLSARRLALESAGRFPEHKELRNMARILAPPQATPSNLPPDPGVRADIEWFKMHSRDYYGQWVAVRAGCLLGAAPTLKALQRLVPGWRTSTLAHIVW